MRLNNIISSATEQLVWPLLRRALIALAFAIFASVAVYYFTIAGNIALAGQYDDLTARLIIGAVYSAISLILFIILWAMRAKPVKAAGAPVALSQQRELQLVMLVEAVMLGYSLARKRERAP